MNGRYYSLNERGEPVREPDLVTWAEKFDRQTRRVAHETVCAYEVSTVFLGLDHGMRCEPTAPILWETMVFGDGPLDEECARCSGTREQAEAMHATMVKRIRAHCPPANT
jgi:hypothetical protein